MNYEDMNMTNDMNMMTPARDRYLSAVAARDAIEDDTSPEWCAADAEVDAARAAYRDSDEPRTWRFGGDGGDGYRDTFERRPCLQDIAEAGDWDIALEAGASIAVMVTAVCEETGEELSRLCQIDPEEPDCLAGCDHEWIDGQVYGRAAGITSTDHCALCGLSRTTYTCSQGARADTEHDHDGIRYHDDDWGTLRLAEHASGEIPEQALDNIDERGAQELVGDCLVYRQEHDPHRGLSDAEAKAIEKALDGEWTSDVEIVVEAADLGSMTLYRCCDDDSGIHGQPRLTREQALEDAEAVPEQRSNERLNPEESS
jgi:hypothetical protein